MPDRIHVAGRIVAFLIGLVLIYLGAVFAAGAGEILVGAPVLVLGGLALAIGATGRVPRWLKRR